MTTTPKVQKVGGDAASGWQIELTDGDTFRCYSPTGVDTEEAAESAALEMWTKEFAPPEPVAQTGAPGASPLTIVLGSSAFGPLVKIGETDQPIEPIITAALRASGLTVEAWNALTDEERASHIALEIADRCAELEPKPGTAA